MIKLLYHLVNAMESEWAMLYCPSMDWTSTLSPEVGSTGIEMLETDMFKLHCFQTLTAIKFIVLTDPRQSGIDALLRKIYEIYSDFALKNTFYSLEMPIRCELFDQNLKGALEIADKAVSMLGKPTSLGSFLINSRQTKETTQQERPEMDRVVLQLKLWAINVAIMGPKLPARFILQDRIAHHVPN
ncbi:uncharacterized protein LOC120018145 isoform X2 [Salvelinus namaycush]|uniref:Trafficking protein particle complex subunit n=1 Tax=Salvelinus namaycush TaxID=8040 RepID=A0A8U0P2S1_SALNM|nr:uncharacterized protein LOC120018145 isoform X2 [Salvelinus namaycush]